MCPPWALSSPSNPSPPALGGPSPAQASLEGPLLDISLPGCQNRTLAPWHLNSPSLLFYCRMGDGVSFLPGSMLVPWVHCCGP